MMRSASRQFGRSPAILLARIVVSLGLAFAGSAAGPGPEVTTAAAAQSPAALLHVVGQIDGLPRTLAWHDGVLLAGLGRTLAAFDVAPDGRATRRIPGAASAPSAFGGPITGLVLDGARAYVRIGGGPLEIVDVRDAAAPRRIGVVDARDVADVLALGTRDIDAPRLDGSLTIGSSGYGTHAWTAGIEVTGDVATIVEGHGVRIGFSGIVLGSDDRLGVRGIDVADPARPLPVTYPSAGSAEALWLSGGVAAGPSSPTGPERLYTVVRRQPKFSGPMPPQSLLAVDLRTPLSPTLRLTELAAPVVTLAAGADVVAAADISGTLRTFDAPPDAPIAPRGADVLVDATGIAVVGDANRAVVTHHGRGVQVVDVADPTAPRILGELRTPGGDDGANAVAIVGAIVGVGIGARIGTANGAVSNAPNNVSAGDPIAALVADGPAGLVVVGGITGAGSVAPTVAARLGAVGDARALAVSGDVAYSVGRAGLAVVDVRDPLSPTLLGRLPEVGAAHAIAVAAGTAIIATDAGSVVAVDVRDPAAPVRVGPVVDMPPAYGLAAEGDTVYAAAGAGGLRVLDATTRSIRATLETNDRLVAVAVADGTAYVAGTGGSLRLADVRDPDMPGWMAAVELPGVGDGVAEADPVAVVQAGGRVYVAAHDAGVIIVKAAVGASIRRAFLPVAMRGYRYTGASDIACGPGDGVVRQPAASPDGRWVVCTDGAALYRSPVDGGTSEAIPLGPLAVSSVDTPVFDARGERILFGCAVDFGGWNVCDVGVDGGTPPLDTLALATGAWNS